LRIAKNLEDLLEDKKLYPFFDNEELIKKLAFYIKERFDFHFQKSKTFMGEVYKEREWTKLYSLHYGMLHNNRIKNATLRVHLFSSEFENIDQFEREIKDNDKSYLGYITIRPIPTVSGSISRARLKLLKEQFGLTDEERNIIYIPVKVHILGKEFRYTSFPFIAQDNVVTVCAHADILMLSKYMFKKFNFNLIEIDTILDSIQTHNGRKIPSDGLVLEQILKVLEKNRYNPSFYQAKATEVIRYELENKNIAKLDVFDIIDVALRSDLCVLMVLSTHIVLIGGYFYKNNEKYYIIYDDSSYYIEKMLAKKKLFSAAIKKEKLEKFLKEIYDEKEENTYLIIPTFDRFYFRYPSLVILLEVVIKDIIEQKYEGVDNLSYKATLIDSVLLKRKIKSISKYSMPHYVWYIEWFVDEDKIGFSVIDATAHKNDIYYSPIIQFEEAQ